jgi:hypothetical protein
LSWCSLDLCGAAKRRFDRVTESFATIYAAGCAAIELKILTWSKQELGEALLRCEEAHVQEVTDKLEDNWDPPTKIGPVPGVACANMSTSTG